ncbi:MAG TPA: phosphomannomutase/phosphoglucomutase [Syntrophomonadaceae bacterium]|nr:phosphomannomutase/phosphoglucomutase [Syntrophomonadaceae bacterium]
MIFIRHIFRKYDIRGLVGSELSEDLFSDIVRAFANYVKQNDSDTILIGHDNRLSSDIFRELAIKACHDSGCNVIDLGEVVTPLFYFASRHLDVPAGIMITASHNPKEYNGLKLLLGESTIYGDEIQKLAQMVDDKDFTSGPAGYLQEVDIFPTYLEMITDKITMGPNRQKVVLDCGNGTASLFATEVFRSLGCEVVELYCDSDPNFPNHHPDPVNPDNMQDLILEVKKHQAHLGIGIDGDGDRIGVVDNEGNLIWGDVLMILFWRDIMPRYPGAKAIVEVKCSQSLIDEIENLGGEPIIYKTGHSLIKAKMKEIDAIFTGEMSGHMFFADEYYGFDDALYAGARLLALLSHETSSLSELLADIPQYCSTPEIRVKSTDKEKFTIVDKVIAHFDDKYEIIDIDGARILFPHGWGLVRASNTGPQLIVRCEGDTPENLENIKEELFTYLCSLGLENEDLDRNVTHQV